MWLEPRNFLMVGWRLFVEYFGTAFLRKDSERNGNRANVDLDLWLFKWLVQTLRLLSHQIYNPISYLHNYRTELLTGNIGEIMWFCRPPTIVNDGSTKAFANTELLLAWWLKPTPECTTGFAICPFNAKVGNVALLPAMAGVAFTASTAVSVVAPCSVLFSCEQGNVCIKWWS